MPGGPRGEKGGRQVRGIDRARVRRFYPATSVTPPPCWQARTQTSKRPGRGFLAVRDSLAGTAAKDRAEPGGPTPQQCAARLLTAYACERISPLPLKSKPA